MRREQGKRVVLAPMAHASRPRVDMTAATTHEARGPTMHVYLALLAAILGAAMLWAANKGYFS